jgi:hypothetical protein
VAGRYYRKYRNAEKLRLAGIDIRPVQKLKTLVDLTKVLAQGLDLQGHVTVRSFADVDYMLNQMSLDLMTPKDAFLAEQVNVMQSDLIIVKQAETKIPVKYKVNVLSVMSLLTDSGVIPPGTQIWQVATIIKDFDLSKLRVKLKGFVQAEGIDIKIDETINLG